MARTRTALVVRELPEIGVTVVSRWIFNCYVIHDGGDGRPLVVDLGLPSQLPAVEQVIRDLGGAGLTDLGAAVATHGHADHLGGLPSLRAAADVPVHLPQGIDDLRAGRLPLRSPGPNQVAQILPVMASQPFDHTALTELRPVAATIGYDAKRLLLPFEPTSWLADGDPIPGRPEWRVIHAPGHVGDSTCLFHAATRTLLGGDSVLSVDGRAWFNPEYVDEAASAATGERLRQLDVEHVLPGHGLPVTGPRVLADALAHDERPRDASKLKALARILTNHAGRRAP